MSAMIEQRVHQQGFTLLEILVAIVVLSLGLLGLAGLQAVSLRYNQTAYYRSIATQQAFDMADRIRANLAGVRAGNYNNLSGTLSTIVAVDPNCVTTTAGCSSSQLATTDYRQWRIINDALMPGGGGTVCLDDPGTAAVDCLAAGSYNREWPFVITVTWTEKTAPTVANPQGVITQSFVTRFRP
ncbi:MAG: type IV pilus modification protein PilV [Pseudomonadota bacterium]